MYFKTLKFKIQRQENELGYLMEERERRGAQVSPKVCLVLFFK